jgi:small subunit ribosomal protein S4
MVKRQKKSYETPTRGWQNERINREKEFVSEYGLKNKREVWKTESFVRNLRREARKLNAAQDEQREQELLDRLHRLGLVSEDAELTEVLNLDLADVFDRRLQTIVHEKGLANTMKEARQFISHGHILIGEQEVDVPGYIVSTEEESNINVAPGSKDIVQK